MDALVNTANCKYNEIKEWEQKNNFSEKYPAGSCWQIDKKHQIIDFINSNKSATEKLHDVINSQLYSHGTYDTPIKMREFKWWYEFFPRFTGKDVDHLEIYETNIWPDEKLIYHNGKNYSIDLFRHLCYLHEIKKHCVLPKSPKVFELGGGCGSFARIFKSCYPECKYVIVDIAESLFFTYIFLRLSFPKLFVKIITENDQDTDTNADFLLIPTVANHLLNGKDFDLFFNTCSLGEMKNDVIRFWLDFAENKIDTKYLFSVNRFLNTVDLLTDNHRIQENLSSISYGRNWKILNWQLEPEYGMCPYYETFSSRYLEIIAEKQNLSLEQAETNSLALINDVKSQDWFTQYGIPRPMTLSDNMLRPDISLHGTLFQIWESIRLNPTKNNVEVMLMYLSILNHNCLQQNEFEESFYYKDFMLKSE